MQGVLPIDCNEETELADVGYGKQFGPQVGLFGRFKSLKDDRRKLYSLSMRFFAKSMAGTLTTEELEEQKKCTRDRLYRSPWEVPCPPAKKWTLIKAKNQTVLDLETLRTTRLSEPRAHSCKRTREGCPACGSKRHEASRCPLQPCRSCGSYGHFASMCRDSGHRERTSMKRPRRKHPKVFRFK